MLKTFTYTNERSDNLTSLDDFHPLKALRRWRQFSCSSYISLKKSSQTTLQAVNSCKMFGIRKQALTLDWHRLYWKNLCAAIGNLHDTLYKLAYVWDHIRFVYLYCKFQCRLLREDYVGWYVLVRLMGW